MKDGWEYKKLGDVCTVIGGATPQTDKKEYWGGSNYWITPAELDGSKYQGATLRKITNEAVEKTSLKLLPIGTVLLSSRAPIGKVAITTVPMYCNQGFKNVVCSSELKNGFVYWYLKSRTDYLNAIGTGATFKEISKKTTENLSIPVPPLAEQERIVAELDLLTEIIDKQKAQLKELDTLAQSIFYDMFGDPVENEKGWAKRLLKDVCTALLAGGDVPKNDFSERKTDVHSVPILSNGVGEKAIYGYTSQAKIFEESITISGRGTIGYCEVRNEPFFPVVRLIVATPNKTIVLPMMLKYIVDSMHLKGIGVAIPQLTIPMVKNLAIIIPPLQLQQEFIHIIQSIEQQEAAITQSIAETQKLFDYTMDKYFG